MHVVFSLLSSLIPAASLNPNLPLPSLTLDRQYHQGLEYHVSAHLIRLSHCSHLVQIHVSTRPFRASCRFAGEINTNIFFARPGPESDENLTYNAAFQLVTLMFHHWLPRINELGMTSLLACTSAAYVFASAFLRSAPHQAGD